MFNYIADGQMSIFDFIDTSTPNVDNQIPKFCEDEKINQLVDLISTEMNKVLPQFPKVKHKKGEYSVWDHVKNLGLRLWYSYSFDCEYLCEPDKWCGVGTNKIAELIPTEALKKVASSYGLELTIMQSPTMISFTTLEKTNKKKYKEDEED